MVLLIGGQNVLESTERHEAKSATVEAWAGTLPARTAGLTEPTEIADARLIPLPTPFPLPGLPSPAAFPPPEALPYVTAPTSTYDQFFEGYFAAGGRDEERIAAMIFCESSWRVNPGGHLGLAQFDSGTWATVSAITGLTDPYNPYDQGFNVSAWASMVSPGSRGGWPSCFYAIDW